MLELYILDTCKYCKKIQKLLDKKSMSYEVKNVANQYNYNQLMEKGGLDQVPYFVDTDNNVRIYNSADIIDYIDKTY